MFAENEYRSCYCGDVTEDLIGKEIKVSGWVENIRDHGGITFLDVRDHYGNVQVVLNDDTLLKNISKETIISAHGEVIARTPENVNPKLKTGKIEIKCNELKILSKPKELLPFEVTSSTDTKEELRLKYRFLDLRNKDVHSRIVLRSEILSFLRNKMHELGFTEIQTPILSASSPEGARDYLIPSRKHQGKFYALPQAPQIFKQLLMVSGFDKYFQVAPCFRDEDSRADRSPGEFYQLDYEMSFATQEDVFKVTEDVIYETFTKFSDKEVSPKPFRRISYAESMLTYGSDKPDLRNPLKIIDVSDIFKGSGFGAFDGKTVRSITVPKCAGQPRKFFDKMNDYALEIGMKGLGYIKVTENGEFNGPINKFIPDDKREELIKRTNLVPESVIFFIADSAKAAPKFAGQIRTELANRLDLIDKSKFEFCFIVDFPMYEEDEETGKIIFTHNPFSMPQGGLDALKNKNPLDILAYQYDLVCNGIELSSGAVRNHDPEIMLKAFEIAGYGEETIKEKFGALYNAFKFGAPPHAGMAPGVDRMIMLLTDEENIREIIAFPMNSNAQDVMLGSPNEVTEQQLREVHIKIRGQKEM
ncbi:MAG: aspartate--tRNA ligase [Clostridia bacterium]|nr:aspartate--tRNA ligase [Clostridia bacterium]